MSTYIVAGGIFKNETGQEWFDLKCPGPGKPPYILGEEVMGYLRLVCPNCHLYRVEEDYTLILFAQSLEAKKVGVQAPERVNPDEELLAKLKAAFEFKG
jgi:hypothetical protein